MDLQLHLQPKAMLPDTEGKALDLVETLSDRADSGYVDGVRDAKRLSIIEPDSEDFIDKDHIAEVSCKPTEYIAERVVCYNPKSHVLNLTHSLCNIRHIDCGLSSLETVCSIASEVIVPSIVPSNGSYADSHSDPLSYHDLWGPDLADEHSVAISSKKQSRSAFEYWQLRQQRFSQDPKLARETVSGRLRNEWERREKTLDEFFKKKEMKDEEIVKSENTKMIDDDFADELTDLANSIADSKWNLSELELQNLLQNSAAIVRGRIEAQLVSEESPIGNPIAEGWFCVMMATWSLLRTFVTDGGSEAEKFRSRVRKKDVPVPRFYWW